MSESYSGLDLVDVLPSLAAGTVGISLDIGRIDFNRGILDLWSDIDAGKGGVTPLCRIKWRNANEAVDSALGLEVAEGMITLHLESYRLDAGLITLLDINNASGVAAAFDPALVHPHEHVCPVARLSATGSGIDRQIGISLVEFPGEKLLELKLFDFAR